MKTLFLMGSRLTQEFISHWRARFADYVDLYLTSGYVPKTFAVLQKLGMLLAYIWINIQVGRIKVIGREYLKTPAHVIYCANHSSMFDPLIAFAILPQVCRYMTAVEEMRGIFGLKALFMGSFGSFAVDRKNGKTVIEPAIRILIGKEALVIFPEGKISPSGEMLPFKPGIALIGSAAYNLLQYPQEVALIPMSINYGKRDDATAKSSYGEMGFRWRGGVTVKVHPPIFINRQLADDPDALLARAAAAIASGLSLRA